MDKRFLIIGDQTIFHALVQVMSLLASHRFECLDTNGSPNTSNLIGDLEKYKDAGDIQGLILFGIDGIELTKHIRLSPTLGNLSLLPIIVVSHSPFENLLREKRDNIFLLSPEVHVIDLSSLITDLFKVIESVKPIESFEKMRADLKPFIVWSEEDDIVSSHDNFNRYGPLRLMKEHFGDLPEYLAAEYETISSKLWFKKCLFLESHSAHAEALPADEELFRKTVANKRVLYIDDEHRLGWSFALHSLFTGNSDGSDYKVFRDNAPVISTSDSRLTCIDNVNDAMKLIETYQDTLTRALTEYSESEHLRNRLAEETAEARKSAKEIEEKTRNAEAHVTRTATALRETETKVKDIQERLKQAMDTFANAYLKGTGEVTVSDVAPAVKGVSEEYGQYDKETNALIKYSDEYKRGVEIFDRHKAELEKQRPLLAEAEAKNAAAIKRYGEAVRALLQGSLFPHDLVILDLRLERLLDKDRSPGEISGVRLLKRLKKVDPSIPVLMFTASEKAMNYQQAIDLGASGYWIKAVNSLLSLKSAIINSLAKAQEARNLWHGIRRIEAKKHLTCVRESQHSTELEKGTLSDRKKAEIIQLLKESFLLFMKELSPYEQTVYTYNHYAKIVLNMGMIQEERFSRIQDKRWDFWVNRKAREIDPDEITIRQLRNRAAHRTGSGITYQDALSVFQKTIEKCLSR